MAYELKRLNLSQMKNMGLRTTGCILLFCERGYAVVSANFERRLLRRGCIVVIFPDTFVVIEDASKLNSAVLLEISPALFDETTFSLSSPFWDYMNDSPIVFPDAKQQVLLSVWMQQLEWIVSLHSPKHLRMMLRNHLCNFFIGIEAELLPLLQQKNMKQTNTVRQFFNTFCQLIVEHCHKQHDVHFYADRLCITPYYLSKITRKTIGISPKELIDRQIVMEIKQLLLSTEVSVKEIANCFHFDSVSYLGRYFRRHTGMTPTKFREDNELGPKI